MISRWSEWHLLSIPLYIDVTRVSIADTYFVQNSFRRAHFICTELKLHFMYLDHFMMSMLCYHYSLVARGFVRRWFSGTCCRIISRSSLTPTVGRQSRNKSHPPYRHHTHFHWKPLFVSRRWKISNGATLNVTPAMTWVKKCSVARTLPISDTKGWRSGSGCTLGEWQVICYLLDMIWLLWVYWEMEYTLRCLLILVTNFYI